MTTTELNEQASGGCSPDGACAVVDDHAPARIGQPAMVVPGAMEALQAVGAAVAASGLPQRTADLVNLRVSQINGCGVCLLGDVRIAKKHGESDDRLAVRLPCRHTVPGGRSACVTTSSPSPRWRWLRCCC